MFQVDAILLNRSIYGGGKNTQPLCYKGRESAESCGVALERTVAGHGWVVNMQM